MVKHLKQKQGLALVIFLSNWNDKREDAIEPMQDFTS
jgi:hypothetical protein